MRYGEGLASLLRELVERDWDEGVIEMLSIDAEAMGFIHDDLTPLHLLQGSLSDVDAALEQCRLASLTPERFSLPTARVVQYPETETAVRPGDSVELSHGGAKKAARVIYVPGVSPQHWEGLGNAVSVECVDGSRFSVGDLTNLRFLGRGPERSIEPDEVV